MAGSIFVGTVGFKITLVLGVDVSAGGATVRIRYLKPDGTTAEWNAVIDSAPNGTISYTTTAAADLDQPGTWKLNGIYDTTGDDIFYGATACMTVLSLGAC